MKDTDLIELSQKLKQGSVTDSGFGQFRECLKYRLERQGKAYIVVDRLALVAKTCNVCGHINDKLITRERNWICPNCGTLIAREVNTARNLRNMGPAQYREQMKETNAA